MNIDEIIERLGNDSSARPKAAEVNALIDHIFQLQAMLTIATSERNAFLAMIESERKSHLSYQASIDWLLRKEKFSKLKAYAEYLRRTPKIPRHGRPPNIGRKNDIDFVADVDAIKSDIPALSDAAALKIWWNAQPENQNRAQNRLKEELAKLKTRLSRTRKLIRNKSS